MVLTSLPTLGKTGKDLEEMLRGQGWTYLVALDEEVEVDYLWSLESKYGEVGIAPYYDLLGRDNPILSAIYVKE